MVIDWLCYIVIGFFSGLSQLMPVSASAIEYLLATVLDAEGYSSLIRGFVHIGCIAALLLRFGKHLGHLFRERHLTRLSPRRRKRQPDVLAVLDGKLLAAAVLPMLLCFFLCWLFRQRLEGLPLMILMLIFTGIFAYIPPYFPGGNRDSRSLTRADGWLLGVCAGLSHIPGLSGLGAALCAGQLRGCVRQYILDLSLMLMLPALFCMTLLDVATVGVAGFVELSFANIVGGILSGAAAFAGGCAGISIVRHLAVRAGFAAFAFYSWGLAMLYFFIYLLT